MLCNHQVMNRVLAGAAVVLVLSAGSAQAQPGTVLSHQKISDTAGGFTGILGNGDNFGTVASLGDLDGDGVGDLAVGAIGDDDGGSNRGAVWVLSLDGVPCDPCDMNCDGTVNALDIEPFIDILFSNGPRCEPCTGDTNGDGRVDALDIEGFINCLFP